MKMPKHLLAICNIITTDLSPSLEKVAGLGPQHPDKISLVYHVEKQHGAASILWCAK